MDNRMIARRLIDHAHYLDASRANLYRARAYRRAAETVLALERPVAEILVSAGREALEELPAIGSHLAYTIECLALTGEFRTLDDEHAGANSPALTLPYDTP
jgi:DNA polymerase/3'-5' exonuclease PolX